jgi:hypothetical protein
MTPTTTNLIARTIFTTATAALLFTCTPLAGSIRPRPSQEVDVRESTSPALADSGGPSTDSSLRDSSPAPADANDAFRSAQLTQAFRWMEPGITTCCRRHRYWGGGIMNITASISEDGFVEDVSTTPPLEPNYQNCITRAVRRVRFPIFGERIVASHVFSLRPHRLPPGTN